MKSNEKWNFSRFLPTIKALRLPLAVLLLVSISLLGVLLFAWGIVKIEPFFRHQEPGFEEAQPRIGEQAPDFSLLVLEAEPFHLAEQLGQRPLVIEFGSVT